MNETQIKYIKETYQPGMSIQLVSMHNEPQMPSGLMGKVDFIDGIGQIHMAWDNGSTLALNFDVDKFIGFKGPMANKYFCEKLALNKDTKTWFRKDPENYKADAVVEVDNETLIREAEFYMEKTIGRLLDSNVFTLIPYDTDSIFQTFLAIHVLTEEETQQLKQKAEYKQNESEDGHCPKCGSDELEYGTSEIVDTYVEYPWECKSCGSTGKEYGSIVFDGHYVNTSPCFEK